MNKSKNNNTHTGKRNAGRQDGFFLKPTENMRLAKYIARSGYCSRRAAEKLIINNHIHVNKKLINDVATNVLLSDRVSVNGRALMISEELIIFLFHKPRGYLCTNHDPKGRDCIFDILPDDLPRLITVGRLDMNSEGLMLLTNDGELARELELPSTAWTRRYRVRVFGKIDQTSLDKLKAGVSIDGIKYGEIIAKIERVQGKNLWLSVSLREGKNREIKNVLGSLNLKVNRLIRTSYGPFQLGDLELGKIKKVPARVIEDQLSKIIRTIESKSNKNKKSNMKA